MTAEGGRERRVEGADAATATAPAAAAPAAPTTFRSGAGRLDCRVVPWDTETFGFGVAEITDLELDDPATQATPLLAAFDGWCREAGIRLASCRLDHGRLQESMALEDHGFRFVEMVYEPRLQALAEIPVPGHALTVSAAHGEDLPAIEAVAARAFTTGRFALDPRLPPDLSGRRYVAWVRSAHEGGRQVVLKAEVEGALVGFFIVERRPGDEVYWHLTAVAPGWQGRGMGLSLWRTMLRRHAAEGARSVATTISAHNLPVINLYARLGFTFGSARMTFHRLAVVDAGADA